MATATHGLGFFLAAFAFGLIPLVHPLLKFVVEFIGESIRGRRDGTDEVDDGSEGTRYTLDVNLGGDGGGDGGGGGGE